MNAIKFITKNNEVLIVPYVKIGMVYFKKEAEGVVKLAIERSNGKFLTLFGTSYEKKRILEEEYNKYIEWLENN